MHGVVLSVSQDVVVLDTSTGEFAIKIKTIERCKGDSSENK